MMNAKYLKGKSLSLKMFWDFIFLLFICSPFCFSQIYTTYHWHMQQPIYWPEVSSLNANTYQKAYESMTAGGAHPKNDPAWAASPKLSHLKWEYNGC